MYSAVAADSADLNLRCCRQHRINLSKNIDINVFSNSGPDSAKWEIAIN